MEETALKIEYLKVIQAMFQDDTFTYDGKRAWVDRAVKICDSIEHDLGIQPGGGREATQ